MFSGAPIKLFSALYLNKGRHISPTSKDFGIILNDNRVSAGTMTALLGGTESSRVPGGCRHVIVGGMDFGLRMECWLASIRRTGGLTADITVTPS